MTCNLHQLSSLSKLSIVCRELLQEQGSSAEISSPSPSFKQVQFHSKQAALRPHQLQFAALIQAIVSDKRLAWPVWNPSADGSLTHQVPRDKGIVSTILFCLRQYHAISPLQKRGDRIAKAFVQFLVYRIFYGDMFDRSVFLGCNRRAASQNSMLGSSEWFKYLAKSNSLSSARFPPDLQQSEHRDISQLVEAPR